MKMESKNTKWYLLFFLGMVWGSSFLLMKFGLRGVNSIQMGSLRILFAAAFLIIIGFKHLPKIPLHKWKYIAITSLFGTFLPVYLFAVALSKIDSSISSILNSLTPLMTLIIGMLFFKIDIQRRQIFGVLIGFIGCLLLVLFGNGENTTENYYYALLILLASIILWNKCELDKKVFIRFKTFNHKHWKFYYYDNSSINCFILFWFS